MYDTYTLVPYNDILKLASDIEEKQTTFIVLFCVVLFVYCMCYISHFRNCKFFIEIFNI